MWRPRNLYGASYKYISEIHWQISNFFFFVHLMFFRVLCHIYFFLISFEIELRLHIKIMPTNHARDTRYVCGYIYIYLITWFHVFPLMGTNWNDIVNSQFVETNRSIQYELIAFRLLFFGGVFADESYMYSMFHCPQKMNTEFICLMLNVLYTGCSMLIRSDV